MKENNNRFLPTTLIKFISDWPMFTVLLLSVTILIPGLSYPLLLRSKVCK